MKFARYVFLLSGIYGLLVLIPQYFMEGIFNGMNPPAITHPEFYYGFIGVALAWQIAFLIMSRDPLRYRPLMLAAVVEKFSFGIAAIVLLAQGRIPDMMFGAAMFDTFLGCLFIAAYVVTGQEQRKQAAKTSAN
ncbi:hypothetical protein [Planctomicrobium piriforme]|uniref:DoxX-like family protein n=1 Tax=Planctomicrobium piriforme TaxID=1576369 RepID=A0A1I3D5B9_9PLAN|nr:hypothetical protein [Planctomicrobium piriforme]SFH81912.1 hypothetical protein SAMN05421753_10398 [Planctomicrobium piriforme]